jgi:hypothetical protein
VAGASAAAGEQHDLDALLARLDDLIEDREQRGAAAVHDALAADFDDAHVRHDADGAVVEVGAAAGDVRARERRGNDLALSHGAPPW